jgi:hypothetical protein
MSYTNNYHIQQAGAGINTSISDHILRKGAWTQNADNYRPIRSRKSSREPKNGLANLVASLIGKFGQPHKNFAQAAR